MKRPAARLDMSTPAPLPAKPSRRTVTFAA